MRKTVPKIPVEVSEQTKDFICYIKDLVHRQDRYIRKLEVFYERLEEKFDESQKTIGKLKYKDGEDVPN